MSTADFHERETQPQLPADPDDADTEPGDPIVSTLVCDHCGGEACSSATLFHDGQGERCDSCGFPGHVVLDEDPDAEDAGYIAHWSSSDDPAARCDDPDCGDCREAGITAPG